MLLWRKTLKRLWLKLFTFIKSYLIEIFISNEKQTKVWRTLTLINTKTKYIIIYIIKNVLQMVRTWSLLVPLIQELAPAKRALAYCLAHFYMAQAFTNARLGWVSQKIFIKTHSRYSAFKVTDEVSLPFRVLAQKSIKIMKWFWESLRVGPDLEHSEIDDLSLNKKALLKSAKTVLRLRISKFFSIIHYICWIIYVINKNWV